MDETMKNSTTEELEETTKEELVEDENETSKDPLREAIETQFRKIQRQNLLIGFQTSCKTVLEKIIVLELKPGKRTMNDYKRLVKDLKTFCETGLSRKVNEDGEAESVKEESAAEKTVQN